MHTLHISSGYDAILEIENSPKILAKCYSCYSCNTAMLTFNQNLLPPDWLSHCLPFVWDPWSWGDCLSSIGGSSSPSNKTEITNIYKVTDRIIMTINIIIPTISVSEMGPIDRMSMFTLTVVTSPAVFKIYFLNFRFLSKFKFITFILRWPLCFLVIFEQILEVK